MFVFDGFMRHHELFNLMFYANLGAFRREFIFGCTPFHYSSEITLAAQEVTRNKLWEFLSFTPEPFVLTPFGKLIGLDSGALEAPLNRYEQSNGFFNVQSGLLNVGEDVSPQFLSVLPSSAYLAPFEGCPIYHKITDDLEDFRTEALEDNAEDALSLIKFWERNSRSIILQPDQLPTIEMVYVDGPNESPDLPDESHIETSMLEGYSDTNNRPASSTDFIVQAVLQAYPDGKGSATWREIVERVGYSRRAIERALAKRDALQSWRPTRHSQGK